MASRPCTVVGGAILQEDEQRHHDEMGELEVLAERFGIAVGGSKPSDLFRAPDSVRRAITTS